MPHFNAPTLPGPARFAGSTSFARLTSRGVTRALGLWLLALTSGCGEAPPAGPADPPPVPPSARIAAAAPAAASTAAPAGGPVAAAQPDDDEPDDGEDITITVPERNTPEWLIFEITRLRTAPPDVRRESVPGKPAEFIDTRIPADQVADALRERYEKMIELAMEAIARTNQDPAKEQVFNNAVHYLADSRLQLALAGDAEQGQLMIDDADALQQHRPQSFAAVEAASKVLQLLQAQAQQLAGKENQWAVAYARRARLFAEQFPKESNRAALNLMIAGRLCENLGIEDEARSALAMIARNYPGTPYAEQVAPTLRRLNLTGQVLSEFAGSTHDGGFVSIEQFRGRPLLIVFWASNSGRFQKDLPALQAALQQHGERVQALGVNLDRDERAVDRFLEESGLSWKQIFYSDLEKRGARNPVARHYGVNNVPAYWLVDARGIVQSVSVEIAELDRLLAESLSR